MRRFLILASLFLSATTASFFLENAFAGRTSNPAIGPLARPLFSLPTAGESALLSRILQHPAAASHFANTQWFDVSGVVDDSGKILEGVDEALLPAFAHLYSQEEFQTLLRERMDRPKEVSNETLVEMARAMRKFMEDEGAEKVASVVWERFQEISSETPPRDVQNLLAKIGVFARIYDHPEIDIYFGKLQGYLRRPDPEDPYLEFLKRSVSPEALREERVWGKRALEEVLPDGKVYQSGDAVLIGPDTQGRMFFGYGGKVRPFQAFEDEGAKEAGSSARRFELWSEPTAAVRWRGELRLLPDGAELRVEDVGGRTAFGEAVSEGAKKILPPFIKTSLGEAFISSVFTQAALATELADKRARVKKLKEENARASKDSQGYVREIFDLEDSRKALWIAISGGVGAMTLAGVFPGALEFLGIGPVAGLGWILVLFSGAFVAWLGWKINHLEF